MISVHSVAALDCLEQCGAPVQAIAQEAQVLDEAALEGRGKGPGSADAASSTGRGARLINILNFPLCCAFAAWGVVVGCSTASTLCRAFHISAALNLGAPLALQLSVGWASAWHSAREQLLPGRILLWEPLACAMWPFLLPGYMTMAGVEQLVSSTACPHIAARCSGAGGRAQPVWMPAPLGAAGKLLHRALCCQVVGSWWKGEEQPPGCGWLPSSCCSTGARAAGQPSSSGGSGVPRVKTSSPR